MGGMCWTAEVTLRLNDCLEGAGLAVRSYANNRAPAAGKPEINSTWLISRLSSGLVPKAGSSSKGALYA
jgi:hypothetical protein